VVEQNPTEHTNQQHDPNADPDVEDRILAADSGEKPRFEVVAGNRRGVGQDQT
jgi:hypothetical protein